MIADLLKPYQRFGVHLGLERIESLLKALGSPQLKVPLIHVAGTNGKGSVCAYLSSVLTAAGYRVGRYTSPHLVHWTERICVNDRPIEPEILARLLQEIEKAIPSQEGSPTQFEVITAAAWLYFAQSQVDIAVVEVGLGGRLDATNICDPPLISLITSISREHWQQLGPTLADIAREKAGILKPHCPAAIAPLSAEAEIVVKARLEELACPATWITPARELPPRQGQRWACYQGIEYPLSLLGNVQLTNSALAIAALQHLQRQGWKITLSSMQTGMGKAQWAGRLQWLDWQNRPLLLDGAHNSAAAQSLRQYVNSLDKPITWVMGMLTTKDHPEIFRALLRPGEQLYLVPVPDHSTAEPQFLADLANRILPDLAEIKIFTDLFTALSAVDSHRQPVLCGSLYLVGHFLSTIQETRGK